MKKAKVSERQILRILNEGFKGKSVEEICRDHNITLVTYETWKQEYYSLTSQQLAKMKELEAALERCKKTVDRQALQITELKEVIERKLA